MKRRDDGVLVGELYGVDCYVRPFCPQDAAPFQWECIVGRGDAEPQVRVKGSARNEGDAVKRAQWYAGVLSKLPPCPV